ncbi:MAG TPA: C13 family peptidase [Povalibacter sp.]|uniref:C13 family peptidase n=1 Tax=Povalibacter sp. TaxID=1962978 RepID=UPI002B8EB5EA|nr:C13 family peptidase [Povalibacter sp.]HMN44940.1 C13 family peptidase [Povalibacter sp.]
MTLPADSPTVDAAQTTLPVTSFWQTIARSLTLRTTARPALAPGDRTLLAMGLILLSLWLAVDYLAAPPDSTFYVYGLLGVGWFASVIVLVAAIWGRLSQPVVSLRSTFALALAFAPVATALTLAILRYLPESAALGALVLVALYATGFAHAALRSLTGHPQPRALVAGLAALSFAAWFAQSQYVTPQFWYPAEDEAFDSGESGDFMTQRRLMESLQFVQAEQIDSTVAAMDRPATLDAASFFVGFAGMGEQRVFASEIALAARTIAAGYDTAQRSLLLVNDRRDLTSHPLASAPALRRALNDVARRMNVDRDVLFLALSSHGAEDGALAVSNLDVPLADLSPQEVADALDEAGIRWRVVIVSACYSGQFIEPLRNDNTIVITASAADRTSFGCADDRDLTYFGEAFYRDALSSTHDLRTAFQRAKAEIAQREEHEGIEPSNPQAHFGRAMERHLRLLSRFLPSGDQPQPGS